MQQCVCLFTFFWLYKKVSKTVLSFIICKTNSQWQETVCPSMQKIAGRIVVIV